MFIVRHFVHSQMKTKMYCILCCTMLLWLSTGNIFDIISLIIFSQDLLRICEKKLISFDTFITVKMSEMVNHSDLLTIWHLGHYSFNEMIKYHTLLWLCFVCISYSTILKYYRVHWKWLMYSSPVSTSSRIILHT